MRVGKHRSSPGSPTSSARAVPREGFEDLKSGVALLGVCSRVFPRLSERRFRMKLAPRYEWEQGLNWESVGQMMAAVKLPSELFDKGGLQACRFKPLYNFLVTLFFLHHVAADADFTADFTHPIDGPVAAYLQSRGAVETLIAGGAVSPDVLPGATPAARRRCKPSGRREREAAPPPASPTRSVSSVASELVAERPLEVRRISDSSEIRDVVARRPPRRAAVAVEAARARHLDAARHLSELEPLRERGAHARAARRARRPPRRRIAARRPGRRPRSRLAPRAEAAPSPRRRRGRRRRSATAIARSSARRPCDGAAGAGAVAADAALGAAATDAAEPADASAARRASDCWR